MKLASFAILTAWLLSGTALAGVSGIETIQPTAPAKPGYSNQVITPQEQYDNGNLRINFLDPKDISHQPIINAMDHIVNGYKSNHGRTVKWDGAQRLAGFIYDLVIDDKQIRLLHETALAMGLHNNVGMDSSTKDDMRYASMALYKAADDKQLGQEYIWYNANTSHYGGIRTVFEEDSSDGLHCKQFQWFTNAKGFEKRGLSVGCLYKRDWYNVNTARNVR